LGSAARLGIGGKRRSESKNDEHLPHPSSPSEALQYYLRQQSSDIQQDMRCTQRVQTLPCTRTRLYKAYRLERPNRELEIGVERSALASSPKILLSAAASVPLLNPRRLHLAARGTRSHRLDYRRASISTAGLYFHIGAVSGAADTGWINESDDWTTDVVFEARHHYVERSKLLSSPKNLLWAASVPPQNSRSGFALHCIKRRLFCVLVGQRRTVLECSAAFGSHGPAGRRGRGRRGQRRTLVGRATFSPQTFPFCAGGACVPCPAGTFLPSGTAACSLFPVGTIGSQHLPPHSAANSRAVPSSFSIQIWQTAPAGR
jgi:hypothetical protein